MCVILLTAAPGTVPNGKCLQYKGSFTKWSGRSLTFGWKAWPLCQEAVGAGRRVGGGEQGGEGRRFRCDARWEFWGLQQTFGWLPGLAFILPGRCDDRQTQQGKGVCDKGTVEGVQRVLGSYPPGGLSRWPGPNKSQPNSKQTCVRRVGQPCP